MSDLPTFDPPEPPKEPPKTSEFEDRVPDGLLSGWRLRSVTLSISLTLFLVNIEVSIVATSLVAIVDDLEGFNRVGWVVTSYLVTYTSLMIIWAKFSNALGRKTSMFCAVFLFAAFSGGCGGAQSMNQLIISRAFQGVGAAGCISVGFTIAYEMVAIHDYPKYAAIMTSLSALGSLVGPLIGGALSENASWRWIFLINVPAALLVCLLVLLSIPNGFPYHKQDNVSGNHQRSSQLTSPKSLDVLGAFLLLTASMLLVTALLEAGVTFEWRSAPTIVLFIISGLLWIAFVLQEFRLSKVKHTATEPIFPWDFITNKAWMGTLLLSMLSGAPYIVTMIDIPQRFETMGVGAFGAGARLIPFNLLIALGAVAVNIVAGKSKIPPIVLLTFGVICQLVGVCLLSTLDSSTSIPNAIYGYQVLTGLGIGVMFGLCVVLPPAVTKTKDLALCGGAVVQFRILGAALGLAVASTVWNNYVSSQFEQLLSSYQSSLVMKTTSAVFLLPEPQKQRVIEVLVHSYSLRMKVLIGFTAAQVIGLGMLWKRPQITFPRNETELVEGMDMPGKSG
ncbi:MFS multidrug transporter-like protein [Periconia macrospinosa]|uniref:MFS multidrug transporter-like protein n=1 Tax=Periconia macrospinosa TaxID=97972 RepID=A0A2V1DBP2_9PLEO|nr:MFS multidrug transporter-like protein [Periconia macrospinosa]